LGKTEKFPPAKSLLIANIIMEALIRPIRQEQETWGIQTGMKIKDYFYSDMTFNIKSLKKPRKFISAKNEFSKIAGYKINM
jgi:hypothetical protein